MAPAAAAAPAAAFAQSPAHALEPEDDANSDEIADALANDELKEELATADPYEDAVADAEFANAADAADDFEMQEQCRIMAEQDRREHPEFYTELSVDAPEFVPRS